MMITIAFFSIGLSIVSALMANYSSLEKDYCFASVFLINTIIIMAGAGYYLSSYGTL